jgi:hypothetical protein
MLCTEFCGDQNSGLMLSAYATGTAAVGCCGVKPAWTGFPAPRLHSRFFCLFFSSRITPQTLIHSKSIIPDRHLNHERKQVLLDPQSQNPSTHIAPTQRQELSLTRGKLLSISHTVNNHLPTQPRVNCNGL